MASVLEQIFAVKREEVEQSRRRLGEREIRARAAQAAPARDFVGALRAHRPAIIAEIKRASPSKGDILPGLEPAAVARTYAGCGAAAISVLTDSHFKGTLADLEAVRAAVTLPLLRKDFMFDPYQVYEARAGGADAILLILAMLSVAQAAELKRLASELGMVSLLEIHNPDELMAAEALSPELIGINNRDLHTFKTEIEVTERLLADYRGGALIVSESGIEGPEHVRRLFRAGARALLIGESLLRGNQPELRLRALAGALDETQGARPA